MGVKILLHMSVQLCQYSLPSFLLPSSFSLFLFLSLPPSLTCSPLALLGSSLCSSKL